MGRLIDVLNRSHTGDVADLVDLCEFALDTDDLLSTLRDTRFVRVTQADWLVAPHPYGDRKLAKQASEFINQQLPRIENWNQALNDLLHAVAVGFSALENKWAQDGQGINYVQALEFRHGHRFRYDETWNLRLYDYGERRSPGSMYGEPLDPRLWTIHQYRATAGYPGAGGLMRPCLIRWMFRRWIDRWRMGSLERFGSPYVFASVPANCPPNVRQEILDQLQELQSEHVGLIEGGGEIKIDGSALSVKSHEAYDSISDYTDRSLTRAWLGASDLTDGGIRGSQAAVGTRAAVTLDPRMVADGQNLSNSLQRTLFRQLILANPQLWSCPADQVPVPFIRYKTADDEIKRDESDLAKERSLEPGAPATHTPPTTVQVPANLEPAAKPQAQAEPVPEDVSKQALNGAQVTSLVDIAAKVRTGELSQASGIAIVLASLPTLSPEQARAIVGEPTATAPVEKVPLPGAQV